MVVSVVVVGARDPFDRPHRRLAGDGSEVGTGVAVRLRGQRFDAEPLGHRRVGGVDREDRLPGGLVRTRHRDVLLQPTGPQEGVVQRLLPVRRREHGQVRVVGGAVELRQQL